VTKKGHNHSSRFNLKLSKKGKSRKKENREKTGQKKQEKIYTIPYCTLCFIVPV